MRTRDENKIEAIYREALQMVVNEGFEGLSMQKLAKAAGVSPATIYIYFKDKEDLLLQLHKRELDKYFAYILDGFDPEMDFASGLAVQWKRRAEYVIKHPNEGHFMENFAFTPLLQKSIRMRDKRFSEMMSRFVTKAIQNKELVVMPFEVYWSVAFAPLYNLVRYHKAGMNLSGEKFQLTDEMLMQTLSLVLKALKPGAGEPVPDISCIKHQ
ncbi:TetR/AcrR family transcriptional regulator [Flavitalea sp. BT771]|uniref:TetR/AcrR family transcriptional regulator n=1 Tax=Flavitalea sp. BT771 TaxID=3063329 RepID=UPI0026E11633|nr:TetR/AcrR family transcriptional regulator [Flavitalea sp. BT771]MDO6429539.1 TetR/AcrR family transcriptional regulator [Flavitalea sp. BT771]MDV6218333.1 TetR/AcrR family transcriptional regulator [Flavitalea sp. BT771]